MVEEREHRRATMLKRLEKVKVDKLDRRLASVAEALQEAESEKWRDALAARLAKRSRRSRRRSRMPGRCTTRSACTGPDCHQEAALRPGDRGRRRVPIAAPLVRQLKKVQDTLGRLHDLQVLQATSRRCRRCRRRRELPEGSLDVLARALEDECRHLHGRYISLAPALRATLDGKRGASSPQLLRPAGRMRSAQDGTDATSTPDPRAADQAATAGRRATLTHADILAVSDSPRRGRGARRRVSGRLEAAADGAGHLATAQGGAAGSTSWASPSIRSSRARWCARVRPQTSSPRR